MTGLNEERIAAHLRALPPAPDAWVRAAQQLPRALATLDAVVARSRADAAFRSALEHDLDRALDEAGVQLRPSLLVELRERLRL
jgi:hypothetical protein